MNVLDAAYLVAHDFRPDGAVGLARRLGISPGTFLNELNPDVETHKLGLGRAVAMSIAAHDFRILQAFAMACDHVVFPLPDFSRVSDAALLDMFLLSDERRGEFAAAVRAALADGRVSDVEMRHIKTSANELAASVLEIVERLKGLRDG